MPCHLGVTAGSGTPAATYTRVYNTIIGTLAAVGSSLSITIASTAVQALNQRWVPLQQSMFVNFYITLWVSRITIGLLHGKSHIIHSIYSMWSNYYTLNKILVELGQVNGQSWAKFAKMFLVKGTRMTNIQRERCWSS